MLLKLISLLFYFNVSMRTFNITYVSHRFLPDSANEVLSHDMHQFLFVFTFMTVAYLFFNIFKGNFIRLYNSNNNNNSCS